MPESAAALRFALVDESSFDGIPAPARPDARCQTCDYWERLDGGREAPEPDDAQATSRADLKRSRLLAGRQLAGAYGMLAVLADSVEPRAVGWCQFGPLSAYPRAQVIRDRYPDLPESPAPWVITCLQVDATAITVPDDRDAAAEALLAAVCDELDRRGITAIEAYVERASDPWLPSPGPGAIYEAGGFELAAGDEHYPVYRRELSGGGAEIGWGDLLDRTKPPDDEEGWPLPLPSGPREEDFFRLPPEKPKRPNPFGDD